jgi:serine protease AprX
MPTQPWSNVSPSFEPFLAEADPTDTREAIVVFRPEPPTPNPRGRLRELRDRLAAIKAKAKAAKPLVEQLASAYTKAAAAMQPESKALGLSVRSVAGAKLPVAVVTVTPATLPALAEQHDVAAILPNQPIHVIRPSRVEFGRLDTGEQKAGSTWGLRELGVPAFWAKSNVRGEGVRVAVLDTGIHSDHPALAGRLVKDGFAVFDGCGRQVKADPPFDGDDHGTHVCGIIAGGTDPSGVAIGVAPAAELLAGAVLLGRGSLVTLVTGIAWAIEQGANVINLSLGLDHYEPLFEEVLRLVLQYDVVPVVAVGNRRHGNLDSPGASPHALGVGALERFKGGRTEVAVFSGGASLVLPDGKLTTTVTKPDVVAPGTQVRSCVPPGPGAGGPHSYAYMDGTSMATPHVSGVVALLMAACPAAPAVDIIRVVRETARHPDPARRPDNRWGHGLVHLQDCYKMLRELHPSPG